MLKNREDNINMEVGTKSKKIAVGATYIPTGEILVKGFSDTWGGHKFTNEEIQMLLNGDEIKVITKTNKVVSGMLDKGEYKGHEYWGFFPSIPFQTAGHTWTEEEKKKLYQGEELLICDFYSPKHCDNFVALAYWDKKKREIKLSYKE